MGSRRPARSISIEARRGLFLLPVLSEHSSFRRGPTRRLSGPDRTMNPCSTAFTTDRICLPVRHRSFTSEASREPGMSLIGNMVEKLLRTGSITWLRPGHEPATFGRKGAKHLTVRFTDRKVAFDILKNPRLGVGEAYMNGRLIIEDGTILDLLEMIVGSNRWEDGGNDR